MRKNKRDVISGISKKTGIRPSDVDAVLVAFIEYIEIELAKRNKVGINGLGVFYLGKRGERTARDINKNKTVIIPARYVADFRMSDSLREDVRRKYEENFNSPK